ncbi:MAG TPA: glycosyltransferase [Candidatus Angelobacter sp.]|nr:glycosyltransferase [Candidatus Angelobacter sp.]
MKKDPVAEGPASATPEDRLSPHHQFKLAATRLAMVLATVFTARYFYWRFSSTMNPGARIFFYAFLAAEAFSFLESLFFYFTAWSPTRYARPKPVMGKTVDVFIPTYNEPVELLRETVVCAVNIKYPHTTYVLDDGNREEVRSLAEEFNCVYLARSDRAHAKAGNLNNALRHSRGEFVITLDADHVASPELIDETIGFFADPDVAIVQCTQDFYNLDSFQHLVSWKRRAGWQQQELFFSVIQPGKDRHNAAFYCGSPGIIRRSALEEIGGFPTGTVTEDMHTSLRLQKKGWRVLYYNKTLARGLAPQTFNGFATQWQRWGQGSMQVLRTEKLFGSPDLNWRQKLCYFSSFYFYWMSYVKLFFVLTPVISLAFGIFALTTDPESYANYFLPYFCLNLACSILLQGGVSNFLKSELFNLLKMHVLMKSPLGLFRRKMAFKVTPKAQSAAANLSELALPLGLIVVLVLALGAGMIRIQHVPRWGYFFWALCVNLFWTVVFLLMMAGVVWRSLDRKEARISYRFRSHLDIPVRLTYMSSDGLITSREHFARNLNRSGVSVTLDEAIVPGTTVSLELWLPEHTVKAEAEVVRNHVYRLKEKGAPKTSNGMRFTSISATDQDEISKYLFWEIAPRESAMLNLTHGTQAEDMA